MNRWFDIDYLKELLDTLTRNRSRTILTGFGVFWGVFMLLALTGGAHGLKELLAANFEGFASNSGFIVADQTSKAYGGYQRGRTWIMDLSDIEAIKAQVPEADNVAPVAAKWSATALKGEQTYSASVKGITPPYYDIESPKLKYGRKLNEMDEHSKNKVCVIGKRVYDNLFPEGGNPCGQFIRVDGVEYLIVGMDISAGNISIGASADRTVNIPFSVFAGVYGRGDEVELIGITAKPGAKVKDALEKARLVLARRHTLSPDDKQAVESLNAEAIFTLMDNLLRGVDILILLVGLGTILAGAIGVSNIMMVTVKERTTEIGIRRAIGATPRMILGQIMHESMILTIGAGLLGLVFSVLVLSGAELAATKDGVLTAHFQIGFWAAVAAVAGLAALGVLAGLAPAMRAMRIKPVDAMRDK